jgi:hypothetical protein
MTVSHKDLTGTDLHEIKGASTATVGQVPIADGAGLAPMGKLTHTSLQTTGNPFGAQLFHVQELQSAGVSSSNGVASGAGNAQVLNTTKTNEISGASLASNVMTLPTGTYYAECMVTYHTAANNASVPKANGWLANTTAGTTLLYSPATYVFYSIGSATVQYQVPIYFSGRFTLSGTSNLSLLMAGNASLSLNPISGQAGSTVFSDVKIWKIA